MEFYCYLLLTEFACNHIYPTSVENRVQMYVQNNLTTPLYRLVEYYETYTFVHSKTLSKPLKKQKMKTMKKVLLAAVAVLTISTASFAQSGRFSIGAELGLPMGDFGDGFNTGFGGSLRYEMPMGDNIGLTGTVGYLMFSGKTPDGAPSGYDAPSLSFIPIMLGAKYYLQEQQSGFYPAVAVGMTSWTSDAEGAESNTDFTWAIGAGYHLDNLDFGLNYNSIATEGSATTYLGLRVAYVLGGK